MNNIHAARSAEVASPQWNWALTKPKHEVPEHPSLFLNQKRMPLPLMNSFCASLPMFHAVPWVYSQQWIGQTPTRLQLKKLQSTPSEAPQGFTQKAMTIHTWSTSSFDLAAQRLWQFNHEASQAQVNSGQTQDTKLNRETERVKKSSPNTKGSSTQVIGF
jgi:hypothetical protein